jgi:hypothetical protein
LKILNRIKIEDCFDGSAVFNYQLSESWTKDIAYNLACLGEFQYFADFPRPFFRLKTESGLFLNGIAGANDCRIVFPRTNRELIQQKLEEVINGYK